MTPEADVQFVIVHHRSPETVVDVVRDAVSCGVAPQHIIVVDNSPLSDPALDLSDNAHVVRVENRGYAAAANYGVRVLCQLPAARALTVVASHETRISPAALTKLVSAMGDEKVAAAGPTLMIDGTNQVWSTGGYFSRWLRQADHRRALAAAGTPPQDREWLDGAIVLYRTELLSRFRFDESYFLYFEETDLHVRLSRAGHRVVWVPDAVSHQRSSGIPPRLLGRNTMLFQARHFNRWTGRVTVLVAMARAVARKAITGRGRWRESREIFEGLREAERDLRGRGFT